MGHEKNIEFELDGFPSNSTIDEINSTVSSGGSLVAFFSVAYFEEDEDGDKILKEEGGVFHLSNKHVKDGVICSKLTNDTVPKNCVKMIINSELSHIMAIDVPQMKKKGMKKKDMNYNTAIILATNKNLNFVIYKNSVTVWGVQREAMKITHLWSQGNCIKTGYMIRENVKRFNVRNYFYKSRK